MALIELQNPINPQKKFLTNDEYKLSVNQSIQILLDSLQNPSPDLSVFTSKFLELIQAKPNPPFETIWVFSALTFQTENFSKDDTLDQVLALKDLFQSITAFSSSCSPSISIALSAPVIFKLHIAVVDLKNKEVNLKKEKKARKEIKSFLDAILGYFNVCCEGSNSDEDFGLVRPISDLVSIWIHGEGTDKNGFKQFFPLLSDEIINWVNEESVGVLGLLAGAVIVEAFLLKLCLKFEGSSRQELQNDLRTWAVCSITGFHNFYVFDILTKILLEPNLTVMSLLSSNDESFLKKILYDVVILPDYSFLHMDKVGHLPKEHIKNNILGRLMVTHEAVEFYRKNNDHAKAISYTNAFSGPHLPTLITKLVTSELGNQGKASQPKGSSPTAFLKWMLDLEDQGLSLSNGFMSKYHARLVNYSSRMDPDQPDGGKTDDDVVFFIDNKGNDEGLKIDDSMNDAFIAAAITMRSDANESEKKRKGKSVEEKKDQVKFQRHDLSSSRTGEKNVSFEKDDSDSASEVEDP